MVGSIPQTTDNTIYATEGRYVCMIMTWRGRRIISSIDYRLIRGVCLTSLSAEAWAHRNVMLCRQRGVKGEQTTRSSEKRVQMVDSVGLGIPFFLDGYALQDNCGQGTPFESVFATSSAIKVSPRPRP